MPLLNTMPNPARCPACSEPETLFFEANLMAYYCPHFRRGALIFLAEDSPEGRMYWRLDRDEFDKLADEMVRNIESTREFFTQRE